VGIPHPATVLAATTASSPDAEAVCENELRRLTDQLDGPWRMAISDDQGSLQVPPTQDLAVVTASHRHSNETQMVSVPHSTIDMCSLSPASVPSTAPVNLRVAVAFDELASAI
jgi:hypothetical protein